ncbi:MAG: gamma-glutamylcyclotransferase, partial [Rhizobiaceae bacterium]|nr:gamma-glutamylcyclotransferase [Rhizobiaceae bacterium]
AEHAAAVVAGAHGVSGANTDYVVQTLRHLEALGIRDPWMADVAGRLENFR